MHNLSFFFLKLFPPLQYILLYAAFPCIIETTKRGTCLSPSKADGAAELQFSSPCLKWPTPKLNYDLFPPDLTFLHGCKQPSHFQHKKGSWVLL